MSAEIEARIKDLGITLPQAAAPAANYVPYVISGSHLYISGQLPMDSGKIGVTGHLGKDVDVALGQRAAELCAINILAQAKAALGGDLGRIGRWSRSTVSLHPRPNSSSSIWSSTVPRTFWLKFSAMPAFMPARPSAWHPCPSTPPSKSTPSSKSPDQDRVP